MSTASVRFALPAEGAPATAKKVIERYESRRWFVLTHGPLAAVVTACVELLVLANVKFYTGHYVSLAVTVPAGVVIAFVWMVGWGWIVPTFRYQRLVRAGKITEVDDPALFVFYRTAYKALGERHRRENAALRSRQAREKAAIVDTMRRLALNPDGRDLGHELERISTGETPTP